MQLWLFSAFLLFLSVLHGTITADEVVVSTDSGQIRGFSVETLLKRRPYYSFKGIPYAKAPLGERRFKVTTDLKQIEHFYIFFRKLSYHG